MDDKVEDEDLYASLTTRMKILVHAYDISYSD